MGITCSSNVRFHQRRGQYSRGCRESQLQLPQRRSHSHSASTMSSVEPAIVLERLHHSRSKYRLYQHPPFMSPPLQSGWDYVQKYCASIGSSPDKVSSMIRPSRLAFGCAILRDLGLKRNTISQYISHVQKYIDLEFAFCEEKTPFRSSHLASLIQNFKKKTCTYFPLAHNAR